LVISHFYAFAPFFGIHFQAKNMFYDCDITSTYYTTIIVYNYYNYKVYQHIFFHWLGLLKCSSKIIKQRDQCNHSTNEN